MKFFKNQALKTISMFALSIILLIGAVLPMSAAGSSIDEYMATYTVKTGDTLSSIAAKYGVEIEEIELELELYENILDKYSSDLDSDEENEIEDMIEEYYDFLDVSVQDKPYES